MSNWIRNNSKLGKIVEQTNNIIVLEEQRGISPRCYVIGVGNSVTLDDKQRVKKHDPFMPRFSSGVNSIDTVYVFYFTNACKGLADAGKDVAEFVNKLGFYNEVVLVGHSKCGVCLSYATEYCNQPQQITLITISTPFKGTVLADGNAMRRDLKKWYLRLGYNLIFSDHPVDRDIAPCSEFIKSLKPPVCKRHVNIATYLNAKCDCRSAIDRVLLWWNKAINLGGDGFVPLESQKTECDVQFFVPASHATSLTFIQRVENYLYINS